MEIVVNNNIKEEGEYDCSSNIITLKDEKYKDFKIINISENFDEDVYLMCRSRENKFKIKVVNFKNYFYVEDVDGIYNSYDDKHKCKKVLYNKKRQKYDFKNFLEDENSHKKLFEFDIKNSYRFSIDYIDKFQIEEDFTKYRVLYFDIETRSSVDVINTPEPIISISYIDSFEMKKVFMTWNEKVLENKEFIYKDVLIKFFTTEKEMLECYLKKHLECDIISGWNCNGFDTIYLFNRLKCVGINKYLLSPVQNVYNKILIDDDRFEGNKFKILGIDILDMRLLVKDVIKFSLNKPTNLTLDKVSQFYLGDFNKIHLKKGIKEYWEEFVESDILELAEYNVRDVEILVELNKKLNLFFYYVNFRKMLHYVNLEETQHNSIIIDKMILYENKNKVFPSKVYSEKIEFIGAYVMHPLHGIYKNVGVFDYNALYPSLIRAYNISPDTIVDEESLTTVKIDKYYFDMKVEGILPRLVDKLITQRYKYKKLKSEYIKGTDEYRTYDALETSTKAVVNSIYGVFGLNSFRLYDNRIASSITFAGRDMIQHAASFIGNFSEYKVLYADTDSLFIHNKKFIEYSDVKKDFEELEVELNKFSKEYSESILPLSKKENSKYMKLECETIFKKIIIPDCKKKYIGVVKLFKGKELENEEIYGRNIDLIKRDCPDAVKKLLKETMNYILYIDDRVELKMKMKEIKEKLKILNYKDLLITKQINKQIEEYKVIPQHVRALKYSNEYLKTTFSRDNYRFGILFVLETQKKYPRTNVIALSEDIELDSDFQINYEKYFELYFSSKIVLLSKEFEYLFQRNKCLADFAKC